MPSMSPYWAPAPPTVTNSVTTPATTSPLTSPLSVIGAPPEKPLLDRCAGDAGDELVEEQVVDDGHGHPHQQCPGHQRAPEVHVAADELGGDAEWHRLLLGDRHERQRIKEVLHRQREREDHRGDEAGPAHGQDHAEQ